MRPVQQLLSRATCLLFDYGGTLDADGIAWKEQFLALYQAEGLVMSSTDFDQAFYRADDPLTGALPVHTTLPDTVRALVANLEAQLGEDRVRGRRIVDRFVAGTEATVARNRPVLQALAKRHRLGIVSNWYGNLAAVCRGLGLDAMFEVIADSHVVGASKPNPALFLAALKPLGASPAATVMIGDSRRRDGEGARSTGCDFIWLTSEPAASLADDPCRIVSLEALGMEVR